SAMPARKEARSCASSSGVKEWGAGWIMSEAWSRRAASWGIGYLQQIGSVSVGEGQRVAVLQGASSGGKGRRDTALGGHDLCVVARAAIAVAGQPGGKPVQLLVDRPDDELVHLVGFLTRDQFALGACRRQLSLAGTRSD